LTVNACADDAIHYATDDILIPPLELVDLRAEALQSLVAKFAFLAARRIRPFYQLIQGDTEFS
jgi:hypothetical protein